MFKKSLSKILRLFDGVRKELEAFVDEQQALIVEKNNEAYKLRQEVDTHIAEKSQAEVVLEKIKDFTSF